MIPATIQSLNSSSLQVTFAELTAGTVVVKN
jgi:hypothetical protein